MIIFKQAKDLSHFLQKANQQGQTTGFVPTMGALHPGHLSLIAASRLENQLTVCSVFVNPTQFNNPDDFKHYPVTIEQDIGQLEAAGCNLLFLPSVDAIYPPGYQKKQFDLGSLETVFEGAFRPGHFQGVCQVVDILLNIVQPQHLYLGQKDYQQCMVVNKLLQLTGNSTTALRIMPTIREADGLAMSSRNMRLTPAERAKAPAIARALLHIKNGRLQKPLQQLVSEAGNELQDLGFRIDYIDAVRADDLQPAQNENEKLVALVAASLGPVRLIDNMPLN